MNRDAIIAAEDLCIDMDADLARARSALSLSNTVKAERHVADALTAAKRIIALLEGAPSPQPAIRIPANDPFRELRSDAA